MRTTRGRAASKSSAVGARRPRRLAGGQPEHPTPRAPPPPCCANSPLKAGSLGMTGICGGEDPNVIQACVWSPQPAKDDKQRQRFSVFF